ncbi:MAG: DNA polymerase III subunit delta [Bacteroidota bacterium]|jgi:DNA polymerase-3 subunit delta
MPTVTFESILKDIKVRKFEPVYFLHGEEPYFIDVVDDALEKSVLDEAEKGFNQSIVYGRDTDIVSVISMAQRYPMMSEYQVVMVREAQDLKGLIKGRKDDEDGDASKTKNTEKDPLLDYLKKPLKSTVLVFCFKHKTVDKRTKVFKELEKSAVVMESKPLYEDKVPAFISSYVSTKGHRISEPSAKLLTDYLGTDLSKVTNELDKVMISLTKGAEITGDIIEKEIGISKDYNVFELQSALARKDILKANRIAVYFGENRKANPFVLTIGTLQSFFNKVITVHAFKNKPGVNLATALKVHPFFMREYETAAKNYPLESCVRIIGWLHEYDLKSKGVGNKSADDYDLLRELLYRILHPQMIPA